MPGRRVMATAQRLWVDPDYLGSGRFAPRGATPLTPTMGRPTDPGENRDPGSDQHLTRILTKEPGLENALYQFSDKPSANTSTTGRSSAAAQPPSLFLVQRRHMSGWKEVYWFSVTEIAAPSGFYPRRGVCLAMES